MDRHNEYTDCSVEREIRWLGGKWRLLIVRFLLYEGPSRFNQLLRGIEGISNKVLAENLRELESLRIVERESEAYALTPSGSNLLPILKELGVWADAHTTATSAPT